jgi:hypothetical protein
MSMSKTRKQANGSKKTSQGNRPQQQQPKGKPQKRANRVQDHQMDRRAYMAPSAISRPLGQFSPQEKSGKNGSRVVRFKEYVQDIPGSVLFGITSFACNPGLSNLFAWLSGQALFYQEYTVKNLKFCFETEKATTLSGKVMYAFLQDSSDPAPASKQEMLENLLKASGAIWEPFCLPISMKNFPALGKSRFIRSGNLAPNLDVKTYDLGQLVVATQGMADTSLVGELYVEYEIELRTPLQSSAQIASALSAKVVGNGTITNVAPYGVTPIITGGLDISATGSTLTFNKVGQYLVLLEYVGTGLFIVFDPTITASTATVAKLADPFASGIGNPSFTNAIVAVLATVTARGQTLVVDVSTKATTVTACSVRVSLYASALA